MYHVIHEFEVIPEHQESFESMYGPEGDWVRLFANSEHFLGTELLKRTDKACSYLTIDKWDSKFYYDLFLNENRKEYSGLDHLGSKLTSDERKMGVFNTV